MKSKKILPVDDGSNDVELALVAFEDAGMGKDVAVAKGGDEALDYLHRRGKFADRPEGHPRVVFLDLKMPKMGGIDVLKAIKTDPELKVVPVVVFSSSKEERDRIECYQNHANAYVVKPVIYAGLYVELIKQLSFFWLEANEPPPKSI